MKKLKLNLQSLNAEVLTRSQLKQILGGDGGSGLGSCTETCPGGLTSCTSDKMDCSNTKNDAGFITAISCDGTSLTC